MWYVYIYIIKKTREKKTIVWWGIINKKNITLKMKRKSHHSGNESVQWTTTTTVHRSLCVPPLWSKTRKYIQFPPKWESAARPSRVLWNLPWEWNLSKTTKKNLASIDMWCDSVIKLHSSNSSSLPFILWLLHFIYKKKLQRRLDLKESFFTISKISKDATWGLHTFLFHRLIACAALLCCCMESRLVVRCWRRSSSSDESRVWDERGREEEAKELRAQHEHTLGSVGP